VPADVNGITQIPAKRLYSASTRAKPKPTTLYLVSPSGAKYSVYTWKASATVPAVIAWAGNKTQAVLYVLVPRTNAPAVAEYSELNLKTGRLIALTLAGNAEPLGYTLPTGQQILGETNNTSGSPHAKITLARYTQAGTLVKALATETGYSISAVYSPNGVYLAASAGTGLLLVSNAGGVLRKLPVPGLQPVLGCTPVRWWNASTILASCYPENSGEPRLWLVPISGAKPSELTPARTAGDGDYGDIDAWQLTSGLYLQSLGACGTVEINKQAKNGSITPGNRAGR
jgi:hypothetical protein